MTQNEVGELAQRECEKRLRPLFGALLGWGDEDAGVNGFENLLPSASC